MLTVRNSPVHLMTLFLAFLLSGIEARAAITVTPVADTESTSLGFTGTGPPGATVTLMVENAPIIGGFSTYGPITVTPAGTWSFTIPRNDIGSLKAKGMVIATSPGMPNVTTNLAALFMPGQNSNVTALAVAPGSSASTPAGTFALGGSFTTEDTNVVYDPTSPDYGNLTGSLLASKFDLTGSGMAGTLALTLDSDETYQVSLLPAWESGNLFPNMISFSDIPISGEAAFNGTPNPFTGTVSGTITFLANNQEDTTFNFNLSTSLGSLTGTVTADGASTVVAIPEPSAAVLTLAAVLCILALAARKAKLPRIP